MDDPKQQLTVFLGRFFRFENLDGDDDIFAAGFVNSLVIVQLISFLENNYSITVEDEDLDIANFRTVNQILSFIARKTTSGNTALDSQLGGPKPLASSVDAG